MYMHMCECVSGGRRMEIVKQTCNILASVVTTKLDETVFNELLGKHES